MSAEKMLNILKPTEDRETHPVRLLSIVTTLYRSALYIGEFVERSVKAASALTSDYEIVIVNDGSPDNALEIALELRQKYDRLVIVDLARNYGHHKAMMAGLTHASGAFVFLIDSDLEEKPELIREFWNELQKTPDVDVVYGIQCGRRKGGWFERISGSVFYKAFRLLADDAHIESNICTIRMMTRRYVKALLHFDERDFYFGPICSQAGFNQKTYGIIKDDKGKSSYSMWMKYHLFLNGILSFSKKPLYAIFYTGLMITFISLMFAGYVLVRKIFYGITTEGWSTAIILLCLFGGFIIFSVGLVAVYVSKILMEVKRRPFYLVKQTYVGRGLER